MRAPSFVRWCARLAVAALLVELLARVLFALRPLPPAVDLQPYQMRDAQHPWHKQLRPGFVETYADARDFARGTGRVLGEAYLGRAQPPPEEVWVRIDRDGFRGPELDAHRSGPRIVTIGDSCTFGMDEASSYPRVLERALRERGIQAEVVNAGVEGYTPADVALELPRLTALHADVATVYLGWNGFFNEEQVFGFPTLATWRLLRDIWRTAPVVLHGRRDVALAALQRPKRVDPDDPAIARLDDFVPQFFGTMRHIVETMRARGSRVVLFTLPGLYDVDRAPTADMLRIGHLPPYTDNPYVLAKLAARLNDLLRQLARDESLDLIDLDAWSRATLQPREHFFFDSVHLTDEGQAMLGRYIAGRLKVP